MFPCRLNKFLALCGVCSRRSADELVFSSHVTVNKDSILHPGYMVQDTDRVEVDGVLVKAHSQEKVWIYHKPRGFLTTHKDPEGRPIVFDEIRKRYPLLPRVISVGRLDFNSEGLLLLTTSGDFAHFAESPKTQWKRCYRVRIHGEPDLNQFERLSKGCVIDGISYGPIHVECDFKDRSTNQWVYVSLYEGKNREIRRVMNHLDLEVSRLIRISFGPYSLKNLAPHDIEKVAVLRK